jgi:type I restriction enzyme, R subunit
MKPSRCHRGIGDPLEPFEDRVRKATRKIESRGTWNQPQRAWLRRIGDQLVQELVVDRAALDEEPFRSEVQSCSSRR